MMAKSTVCAFSEGGWLLLAIVLHLTPMATLEDTTHLPLPQNHRLCAWEKTSFLACLHKIKRPDLWAFLYVGPLYG